MSDNQRPLAAQRDAVAPIAPIAPIPNTPPTAATGEPPARLLLDITATESSALKTGIQRVTLELFQWLSLLLKDSHEVVPVYLKESRGKFKHCRANAFEYRLQGAAGDEPADDWLVPQATDTLLHLDLATTPVHSAYREGLYADYQARGVRVFSLVYDLLPIQLPDCFPPGTEQHHRSWLEALASFDGALCISQDVAQAVRAWFKARHPNARCQSVDSFLLGADIGTFNLPNSVGSAPTAAKSPPMSPLLPTPQTPRLKRAGLGRAKTFLMVGTIEPRKGYAEVLDAFDELWRKDADYRLIIVGREGWAHLPDSQREAITAVTDRVYAHPQRFRKLIWLPSADDEQLELAYRQADCLIAASLGEGFGLPIIESASRGVPVLARDIAVFREVAPPETHFFATGKLVSAMAQWQPLRSSWRGSWRDPAHATPSITLDVLDALDTLLKFAPDTPPVAAAQPTINITWQDSAQLVLNWLDMPARKREVDLSAKQALG